MYENFKNFILGLDAYNKNLKIAVSYSGGVDSGVLLNLFVRLFEEGLTAKPSVIYFNHNLRGIESINEWEFVDLTVKKSGLELILFELDVLKYSNEKNLTIETAARELRYKHYDELSGKLDYIAQGHHADDNSETILYNILRGSGLEGASGIKKIRGKFIRPLLNFTKQEILTYADGHKIEYIEDSSNSKSEYTRNKIRNLIIPFIEKELDRNVRASILRFSRIVNEANELISSEADKRLKKNFRIYEDIYIANKTDFLKLKPVNQKIIINRIFKRLGSSYNMNSLSLTMLIEKINRANFSDIKLEDISVSEHLNNLIFVNKNLNLNPKISFKDKAVSDLYFDFSKIKGKISMDVITTKDYFMPFGKGREEKISKVLSDKKIPKVFRSKLVCLKDDEKIIFIQGVGISDSVKTDNETKSVKYIKITKDILKKLY